MQHLQRLTDPKQEAAITHQNNFSPRLVVPVAMQLLADLLVRCSHEPWEVWGEPEAVKVLLEKNLDKCEFFKTVLNKM
jgi:hypothetical protein